MPRELIALNSFVTGIYTIGVLDKFYLEGAQEVEEEIEALKNK